ncbi:hypothetical protein P8935_05735 [Telmatobacter sp. DSM 110680]|uniref:DUF3138 family protein n=1 Tax=Telmatobacter sp. DSM 110680 TaxID=3036704 RepID=A0AAU7DNE3_9BACT
MIQYRASVKRISIRVASRLCAPLLGLICAASLAAEAQQATDESLASKVQQLTEAMSQAQSRLDESQRQMEQLRAELARLRQQMAQEHAVDTTTTSAAQLSAAVDQIREQQSLEETQIATHEQAKVESESKYPLKLSGLVLLTGYVNTALTDDPVNPTLVLEGAGATGASLRQTVLGIDAHGPHLFNARTHADVRVDFDGASLSGSTGSPYGGGLIRLRTAHASLNWDGAEAFFSLDHAIVVPNSPTSLTAVAVPALSWSGNLWTWNPQVGMSADFPASSSQRLRLEAALIDVMNSPQIYNVATASANLAQPSTSEMSRWPGVEGRVAFVKGTNENGLHMGFGGLYVPHKTQGGTRFNSWAGTLDYRIPLPGRAEFSGSGYWGQALGGLGGGAYKDYVYRLNPMLPSGYSFRTLDDFGGWAQWKERTSEHLEFNVAFGTDQVPAAQLRPYSGSQSSYYLNLARNRTFTGNVIYRPSAYLLFSLEYRHLMSSPVNYYTATGDIIGIATGYRF